MDISFILSVLHNFGWDSDGWVVSRFVKQLQNNVYVTVASAILSSLTLMFMRQDKSEAETKENLKPQAFKNYNPYTSIEYN